MKQKKIQYTEKDFFFSIFEKNDLINLVSFKPRKTRNEKDVPIKNDFIKIKDYQEFSKENLEKYQTGFFCFTPNPLKSNLRSSENVKVFNSLFIDIDKPLESDLETILENANMPSPSIICTRENNLHLYWLLDRQTNTKENLEKFSYLEKYFCKIFNADKMALDSSRLLRIPFSKYKKFGVEKESYKIEKLTEIRYKLSDLYTDFEGKNDEKMAKFGFSESENQEKINKTNDFEKIIKEKYNQIIKSGFGRSRNLLFFGYDCFDFGLDFEKALNLALEYNKNFFQPPENEKIVLHQIKSAYKYAKNDFGQRAEKFKKDSEKELENYEQELKLRKKLKSCVYIIESERFINFENGLELTTNSQIQTFLATQSNLKYSLNEILRKNILYYCHKMDFNPLQERKFFRRKKLKYFNRFFGIKEIVSFDDSKEKKALDLFLNHIKYLTNDEMEENHLLNYFAFLVQNKGVKISHALLIISKYEGVGKSILEKLFQKLFEQKLGKSFVSSVENTELMSDYNDFTSEKLICFIHELSQGDKYSTMNKLKSLITENEISVNSKYARKYTIANTTNFIFFSNLIDAIKIGQNDRRLFVVYNEKLPKPKKYYSELYEAFTKHYFLIYDFLLNRDLKNFSPFEKPEITEGKKLLLEFSENELHLFLDGLLEDENHLVNDENGFELKKLIELLEISSPQNLKNKITHKNILSWLNMKNFKAKTIDERKDKIRTRKKVYFKEK